MMRLLNTERLMLNRLTLLSILFLAVVPGRGRDIYVATNGAGGGVPLFGAWTNASSNIEWAVNVGINGDTVWISNGVYVLTNQITVNSNITVSGADTNNKPVINGNDAARCFYFAPQATGVLANLFITRGYIAGDGGGAYFQNGTVRDCVFSNNICTNRGGGMFFAYSTGIVQRCTFIDNKAYNGGGLYLDQPPRMWIENCLFYTNIAFNDGGGLYGQQNCYNTIISGCDFICNVASNQAGGAYLYAYYVAYSPVIVTHCTVSSNVAVNGNAGGIYLFGRSTTGWIFTNSFVSNNICAGYGGGVQTRGGFVKNCVIARNRGGLGGGIYDLYSAFIQDSVIEENMANTYGGGLILEYGPDVVQNCLIVNNFLTNGSGQGGGIRISANESIIRGCTIASNYSASYGGGIFNGTPTYTNTFENCIIYLNQGYGTASNYYNTSAGSSFSNNCFAPAMDAAYTNYSANNITNNPQFIDRASGNYRLERNSPCVNAGVNRDWTLNAVDLDGHSRIDKYTGIIDMGCYEYLPSGTMYGFQ